MQHHRTIIRSPGAAALGALCTLGTFVVLFWYVRSPGDFTLNHVYILLALAVTYGAGHFMWDAFGEKTVGGFLRGLAFLLLFAVGTVICVGLSGGRSAEILERKATEADHENGRRIAHEAKIVVANTERRDARAAADKAQADADEAARQAATECASGRGSRCDGKTKTAEVATVRAAAFFRRFEQVEAHYWVLAAQLDQFKAPVAANAELRNLAKVLAHITGRDEQASFASVLLLLPYMLALMTEFGSIVFFKHGIGHVPIPGKAAQGVAAGVALPVADTFPSVRSSLPSLPRRENVLRLPPPDEHPVVLALRRAGQPLSNEELATAMRCSAGEASKRTREISDRLVIGKQGRALAISLRR